MKTSFTSACFCWGEFPTAIFLTHHRYVLSCFWNTGEKTINLCLCIFCTMQSGLVLPGCLSHHQKEENQDIWAVRHNEYGWRYVIISFLNMHNLFFHDGWNTFHRLSNHLFFPLISSVRCANYSWQRPHRIQWLFLLWSSGQQRWSGSCHAARHLGRATSQIQILWFVGRHTQPQERLKQYFEVCLERPLGFLCRFCWPRSCPVHWLMGVQDVATICLTPLLPEIAIPKCICWDIFLLKTMLAAC